MIISKINGGIGNQMFQYSVGKCLAKKNNTNLELDISLFNLKSGQTKRNISLNNYKIEATINSNSLLSRAKKHLNSKLGIIRNYVEKSYEYNHDVLNQPDNTCLLGYWQSYKYADDIKSDLLKQFTPKIVVKHSSEISTFLSKSDTVAVHIRRGDYVTNPDAQQLLGVLPLDYYASASDYIASKLKNPQYIIVSDDIVWCKHNLHSLFPKNTLYIHNGEKEDLDIMTKTRHNIIANSSYSWWGAYLKETQIVVSPKSWFRKSAYTTKDLIPASWIQI